MAWRCFRVLSWAAFLRRACPRFSVIACWRCLRSLAFAGWLFTRCFREVRAADEVSIQELFFSVVGIRPLVGRAQN
jgi:hypothetical protein